MNRFAFEWLSRENFTVNKFQNMFLKTSQFLIIKVTSFKISNPDSVGLKWPDGYLAHAIF